VLHVAGTNGKGSTCAFLGAILEAGGFKVHMYTSPHLVRFNERIRVAGKLIGDDRLAGLLEEVLDSSDGIEPSFFEVATAAAFLAFARSRADACVVEVGLGGRLDATNVVDRPLVCGIAGLGIDHRQWLGRRMSDIAAEKAAIAKHNVPLVTQRYAPLAAHEVQRVAERAGAHWIGRGALWEARVIRGHIHYRDRLGALNLPMPSLAGRYQADNAALAVAMLRSQQHFAIDEAAYGKGIAKAQWPARLQKLGPGPLTKRLPAGSELWLDGGHNGSAARLVADHVRREWEDDLPLVLVFASLATKSPRAMLKPFRGLTREVHTVPIPSHEHFKPESLARLAGELGFTSTAEATFGKALDRVKAPSRVLIFGSLYLAGEVLKANREIPD
jgi:dihydrofolate synthase/folylpolyglutamate synthase